MYFNIKEKELFDTKLRNKASDWQDIINIIEKNFNITDIHSWNDFYDNNNILNLLTDFVRITKYPTKPLNFTNLIIKEIFIVAEYFNKKYQIDEIKNNIQSNLGKLLLLIVGITQLENKDNKLNYIYDLRLWTQYNIFQLLNLDSICKVKDEIIHFLNTIHIKGIENYQQTLINNIEEKNISIDFEILEKNKDKIFNVNSFNFNNLKRTSKTEMPDIISWQENFLLDMLMVKISNNEIIPFACNDGITNPDMNQWTPSNLNILKQTTQNDIADFIVETIDFMKNNTTPSNKVIKNHINLFLDNLEQQTEIHKKYHNSSFFVLKKLLNENILKRDEIKSILNKEISRLYKELSQIKDVKEIEYLKKNDLTISKKQKIILKDYMIEQINKVNTIRDFSKCLSDNKNNKNIDNEWFLKCHEKFRQLLQKIKPLEVANAFIDYMLFLMTIKQYEHLDKKIINHEIIQIQKMWTDSYFDSTSNNLTTFTNKEIISNEQVQQFNDINFLVNFCMITTQQQHINMMKIISENPILSHCNWIYITPSFPIDYRTTYDEIQNDIDKCTLEIIQNIQKQQAFINSIDDLYYLKTINQSMIDHAKFAFTIFNNTEELYLEIQQKLKGYISLIDYNKEPQLAHLTQLFPIIEILIQKIGIQYNIFPFKENINDDFMKVKDSSSILRQILITSFKKYGTFDHTKDLLFVYHYLYNSHSLNIRNECVHGRNYLAEDSLTFALKITLSSVYILIQHLNQFYDNKKE